MSEQSQIKLVISAVAITAVLTGGAFTAAFKLLDIPQNDIHQIDAKIDQANETLTTIRIQQALMNQKIDNHVADGQRHNGNTP